MVKNKYDNITNPRHYAKVSEEFGGIEPIQITSAYCFKLGCAIKYIVRAPYKKKTLEDLEKARWYVCSLMKGYKVYHPIEDLEQTVIDEYRKDFVLNALINEDGSCGPKNLTLAYQRLTRLIIDESSIESNRRNGVYNR